MSGRHATLGRSAASGLGCGWPAKMMVHIGVRPELM
jgi:hypothetical protein